MSIAKRYETTVELAQSSQGMSVTNLASGLKQVVATGFMAGPRGLAGTPGRGVPSGGVPGQYLAKASNTDYDLTWRASTTASVNVKDYGAVGDGRRIRQVVASSGSPVVTSTLGNFTLADVGKIAAVYYSDATGTITTVQAVNSPTSITLAKNAGITVNSSIGYMIIGTDDSAAIQAALNSAGTQADIAPAGDNQPTGTGRTRVTVPGSAPNSYYLFAQQLTIPGGVEFDVSATLVNVLASRNAYCVNVQPFAHIRKIELENLHGTGIMAGVAGQNVHILLDDVQIWHTLGSSGAPTNLNGTTSTTGGTLSALTRYYAVAAIDAQGGETLISNEKQLNSTGSTSSNSLTWDAYPGAVSYKIYRGTVSGKYFLYFTSNTNSFTDTGGTNTGGFPLETGTGLRLTGNHIEMGRVWLKGVRTGIYHDGGSDSSCNYAYCVGATTGVVFKGTNNTHYGNIHLDTCGGTGTWGGVVFEYSSTDITVDNVQAFTINSVSGRALSPVLAFTPITNFGTNADIAVGMMTATNQGGVGTSIAYSRDITVKQLLSNYVYSTSANNPITTAVAYGSNLNSAIDIVSTITTGITHATGTQVGNHEVNEAGAKQVNNELRSRKLMGTYFDVKAYGAKGDNSTDDTTAIQAAFDAAKAAGGGVVFFPVGTYISGQIVWKGKTNIQGAGMGKSIIKPKNALNNDLIITENWATEHNVNYNSYTTMDRSYIRDISLWGNRNNQTIQGVQTDKANYHYLLKYYGWLPTFQNLEFDDCEAALYTEFSNNQPHNPFENYELFEGSFTNIRAKNYARAGWTFRGPHDSHISDVRLSGGDYDTPDYHFLADNNGNYGGQGSYLYDVHAWGNTSPTLYDFIIGVALTGDIYAEGSTNSCVLITCGSNNLRIYTGYQDTDNNGTNDAAVVLKASAGQTVTHNNLNVIGYWGPHYGDLVRVENAGGTIGHNDITATIFTGSTVNGALFKLVGNSDSNRFRAGTGTDSPTGAIFDTSSYTGGNNTFEARVYNHTIFSTPGNVGKSDLRAVQNDNYPDTGRVTDYRWPVRDKSVGFVSTTTDAYVDVDSLQVRNVADPTAAQHAATKNYTDTALAAKAPLASPALTGTPTAPTPTGGDSSTKIATTAFVTNAVTGLDDVLEYANLAGFPATGTGGMIYVADDTGYLYRWSGSAYIQVGGGTASDATTGSKGIVQLAGDLGGTAASPTVVSAGGAPVVTTTGTQTLTNKTLTGAKLTGAGSGTAIIQFASTSTNTTATIPSEGVANINLMTVGATQTPTNKILSGATNTFSNIPESAVTNLTTDLAAKEPIITAGTTGQYWRGDKSWQTLNQDAVPDGTTNKAYSATDKTKLAGIATAATANSSDATLLNRANHTGTQAESTITNLTTDLASKEPTIATGTTGQYWRGDKTWQTTPTGLPTQTSNARKALFTDGTSASWLSPAPVFTVQVAASDSSTLDKARADYVCTGTNDHTTINTALATGMKVQLSSGNFAIAGTITMTGAGATSDTADLFLLGSGSQNTFLNAANNIDAITISGGPKVHIENLCIKILGSGRGIVGTGQAVAPYYCFWLSTMKNILVLGDFSTSVGQAFDFQSPFRSTFENIEVKGTKMGIKLASHNASFNPGNCVFTRCFIDLPNGGGATQKDGVGYWLKTADGMGKFNLCTFIQCEGIDNNSLSTASRGWYLQGSGTDYSSTCNIVVIQSNVENFNYCAHLEHATDNDIQLSYSSVKSTGTIFYIRSSGAGAYTSNQNRLRVRSGYGAPAATTVLVDDNSGGSTNPNTVSGYDAYADTGSTVSIVNSSTTIIEECTVSGPGTIDSRLTSYRRYANQLRGVDISSTAPGAGQVLQATSASAASWKDTQGSAIMDALRKRPILYSDFLVAGTSTCDPFVGQTFGTGPSIAAQNIGSVANHPGMVKLNSGTTASSGGFVGTNTAMLLLGGGEVFEAVFYLNTLALSQYWLGFIDTASATEAVDGAYISIDSSGVVTGKTSNNSTRSSTGTTYSGSTATWYRIRITVNNTSLVTFELFNDSGTQLWTDTLTTNIPTASGRDTGAGVCAYNTGTTAVTLIHVDYMAVTWVTDRTR